MAAVINEVQNNPNLVAGFYRDIDFTFPNVQSCVAAIGVGPANLHGVHLTIGEKNPSDAFRTFFDHYFSDCRMIYLVGGITTGGWSNTQLRRAVGVSRLSRRQKVRKYDTSDWVDLHAPPGVIPGVTICTVLAGGTTIISATKGDGSAAKSVNVLERLY